MTKAGPWPPTCEGPRPTGDGLRQQWTGEIANHLDENRVVRALRLAARPPEPSARMEPELTQRLSDAAGEAMGSDTPADRWLALIDAVSASPVRRSVKPAGLPADPTPELRRAAHQQSGRIPALAAMLGVAIPPPPTPIPAAVSPIARDERAGTATDDTGASEPVPDDGPAATDDQAGAPDVAVPEVAAVAAEGGWGAGPGCAGGGSGGGRGGWGAGPGCAGGGRRWRPRRLGRRTTPNPRPRRLGGPGRGLGRGRSGTPCLARRTPDEPVHER